MMGAVQHAKMSGIPLRIFLEGSRGVKSSAGNSFFPANMFQYVQFEVKYENRPEWGSRGSSRRADTAILHDKSLRIQWNCSQTPNKYIKIYKNSRSTALAAVMLMNTYIYIYIYIHSRSTAPGGRYVTAYRVLYGIRYRVPRPMRYTAYRVDAVALPRNP